MKKFCANRAPDAWSRVVCSWCRVCWRSVPSTHSTKLVTTIVRAAGPSLVSRSREILTGSDSGTVIASSDEMPFRACENVVTPGACTTRYAASSSAASIAGIGPGVGVHDSPDSASWRYSTSPEGSLTGSLNHGVSR
jgi:hypothetical protein